MILKFIEILQTPMADEKAYDKDRLFMSANLAIEIENIMFEKYKDIKAYSDKARSLVFNLKDPKNPDLRFYVMTGQLEPLQLVTMSPKDLASEAAKQERKATTESNMQSRRTDWHIENAKATKGFFTCKKCKSQNTTYF